MPIRDGIPCKVYEEIYTHEHLWRSASILLEKNSIDDPDHYFLLPSLLISYMAYEAFINFCGFISQPEKWKNEKENLKGLSTEEKIALIIPGFKWDKGAKEYQLITRALAFRNLTSHGKVIENKYHTLQKSDGTHLSFMHNWDSTIKYESAIQTRAAIQSFCQKIVIELRKSHDHSHLEFDAFTGPLGSGSSISTLEMQNKKH